MDSSRAIVDDRRYLRTSIRQSDSRNLHCDWEHLMDPALIRLQELFPPPTQPKGNTPNWELAEKVLEITYPQSFKDYVHVYGWVNWFDNFIPIIPKTDDDEAILKFQKVQLRTLERLRGWLPEFPSTANLTLYPDPGGLFPILDVLQRGWYHCWQTVGDPENWSVCSLGDSPPNFIGKITIAGMIVEYIERSERMMSAWGDYSNLPVERKKQYWS